MSDDMIPSAVQHGGEGGLGGLIVYSFMRMGEGLLKRFKKTDEEEFRKQVLDKLDAIGKSMADQASDARVLRVEFNELKRTVRTIRRRVHDLANTVTVLAVKADVTTPKVTGEHELGESEDEPD